MIPETLTQADRELFEEFLGSLTMLRQQVVTPTAPMETEVTEEPRHGEEEEAETTSTKISKGLITGR